MKLTFLSKKACIKGTFGGGGEELSFEDKLGVKYPNGDRQHAVDTRSEGRSCWRYKFGSLQHEDGI